MSDVQELYIDDEETLMEAPPVKKTIKRVASESGDETTPTKKKSSPSPFKQPPKTAQAPAKKTSASSSKGDLAEGDSAKGFSNEKKNQFSGGGFDMESSASSIF